MVMDRYRIIVRVWAWFESVRKALRVSRKMSSGETRKEPVDIDTMGKELNRALSVIRKDTEFSDGELEEIYGVFKDRIEGH